MKRILAVLILTMTTAYALPLGNPADASLITTGVFCDGGCNDCCDPDVCWWDTWNFRIGFYGDYVYDRHLEAKDYENHPTIHQTEITTNAAYLALNFCSRFDVFSTLGASSFTFTSSLRSFSPELPTSSNTVLFSETHFSWSLGARATVWECGSLAVGAEAQYFRAKPLIKSLELGGVYSYLDDVRIKYEEWQIGLGTSYRINIASCATAVVPYIGIDYSDLYLKLPFGSREKYDADRCFGYVLGITLLGCEKMTATLEGRFANETALHINFQFRI